MVHTFNKIKSVLALSLVLAVIAPTFAGSVAMAQNKRVMLEEFTGAWCGWCVRGALALQQLRATYPGQVIAVSFHNDQGSPVNDQMSTPQGDTLAAGISSLSAATAVTGFPDGWTARTPISGTWNIDPGTWIDTVNVGNGLAEQMLNQPTSAVVTVDSISYNPNTGMITARVNANFKQAVSGDLRFNLYVIEDSVTGGGQGYDQHNYYYQNSSYPQSPYYNLGNPYLYNGSPDGSTIPGFYHMQVFRYAPTPIWGLKGVIPATGASAAGKYSKVFTFPMPATIQDSTHVKLIGFVSQYSSTSLASNGILDADMEPLLGSGPKYYITSVTITPQTPYATAKSSGTMPDPFLFTNNGTDTVTLNVTLDQTGLPSGWTATTGETSSITLNPGATSTVNVNVTSPLQSGFASIKVLATPVKPGYVVSTVNGTGFLLSDNTKCPIFYDPSSTSATPTPDAVMTSAIFPDSLKSFWAIVPLSDASIAAYPPENFPVSIYDNIMCLDNGSDPTLANPTILPNIVAALAKGGKVFISSDYALGYVFDDGSNAYYGTHIGYTQTQDAIDFYNKLGLSWAQTIERWNASSGAKTSFAIKGKTGDPIGNGVSATDGGGFFSCVYTIDSASAGSFVDTKSKDTIGSTYVDPTTHARLVYLGFGLSELTSPAVAKTIATNSINWLMGTNGAAAVNTPALQATGLTASPNPFQGTTQVTYTAAQGETGVTFAAYDLLGRELMSLPAHASGTNYTASFDGSTLADGTYVIMVHSSKGTSEVRVVNQQ